MKVSYEMYQEYSSDEAGTMIPEAQFEACLFWAEAYLQQATMGKAAEIPEALVVPILCRLSALYYDASRRNGVVSENVDGYRVTFSEDALEKQASACVVASLAGTGLLYRGIG